MGENRAIEKRKTKKYLKNHAWYFLDGCILVLPLFLFYKFLRFIIEYGDSVWNGVLFQPLWSRNVPIAGFLLSIIIIYAFGRAKATAWGAWLHQKVVGSIPVIGKVFTAPTVASQRVLQEIGGFVYAPIQDGYRPARFTARFRMKGGGWWTVLFFPMLPTGTTQAYPDSVVIWALKRMRQGQTQYEAIPDQTREALENIYTVFPTEIGLRAEFTGGTTVPEDAFLDLAPVTLADFWRSQQLMNGAE